MSPNPTRGWLCLLLILLLASPAKLTSAPLSIKQAEHLALERDPTTARYHELAAARENSAEAARSLPNPVLIGEAMNLPIDDGFRLDRTPMTQITIGLRQTFPRGDTRALSSARERTRATAELARARDAGRTALRGVRQAYLELLYQRKALTVLAETRELFQELLEITEREFAAGRGTQQAVLEVELELERLEDRISTVHAAESAAEAEFARWVGNEVAARPLTGTFPELPLPHEDGIRAHPLLRAEEAAVEDGRQGIELARQGYRAEWSLQLSYGRAPGARAQGGVDRLSGMLMVDLPLFSRQRQDSEVAASQHQRDAAMLALTEQARDLDARHAAILSRLHRLDERDTRFRDRLLESARANAEAADQAYRAGTIAFSDLIRARVMNLQTRLDSLRVFSDRRQTQAELLYLLGEEQ